ncbi:MULTISPECIES: DUF2599 domain-containing protein [Gordonia]|uniref:DUF2599 domain-containing protein n=1 Tax=Gordonia sihwensis NBRC 108236 TaxID=1223544 RepID=L7LDC3_9ACTN|nr:DUF2599 domain-containing protein [Gordonia sp. YC-JH1]MBY4569166.1 hypothetical protein [Gordonia sihwensis]GAC59130.1 hypothetical protein GSI01S_01_00930 [Gordonia sihwensis NBRC 108236]
MIAAVTCTAAIALAGCSGGNESAVSPSDSIPTRVTASSSVTSSAPTPVLPPPYIASADWVQTEVGPSLQIAPTPNGRRVQSPTAGDEAWREVLRLDPGADTPGMKAQFDCHWTFARIVQPDKPTWNIEPNRPVVSPEEMISSRCNPGGPEE